MIFSTISKITNVFERQDKKELIFLFFLIFIAMLLETLGISLVIPVVMSILDKDIFTTYAFLSPIYSFLGNPSQKEMLISASIFLVFVYFIKNLFLVFFLNIEGSYIFKIQKKLTSRLFKIYISQKHYNYIKGNTSKLISNIITDSSIFTNSIHNFLLLTAEISVGIGILTLLFIFEPIMIIFNIIIVISGMLFFHLITKKRITNISLERKRCDNKLFLTINNSFSSIKEINIFGKNEFFENIYNKNNYETFKVNKIFHVVQGLPKIFYELVGLITLVLLIIMMALTFKDYTNMLPFLAIAGVSAFRLIPSANRILKAVQYFKFAEKSINIINEELKHESKKKEELNKKFIYNKEIKIKDITFKYPDTKNYIIKNINAKFSEPDKILIYGETGSGKSTFIELILGFLKPTIGNVQVENNDVHENFYTWSQNLGYVPQKITLIDGNIMSNIAFGVENNKTNKKMLDLSVRVAGLDLFISKLPDGLKTLVGEKGSKLSGGQIQRVGIARAIYKNPEILILDEATNALDEETEKKVVLNLISHFNNKIIIFISHNKDLLDKNYKKFKIENESLVAI